MQRGMRGIAVQGMTGGVEPSQVARGVVHGEGQVLMLALGPAQGLSHVPTTLSPSRPHVLWRLERFPFILLPCYPTCSCPLPSPAAR